MGDRTAIEWTTATWNPITGCSKVSPGCAHCYAEAISLRFGYSVGPWTPENATENVVLHPERLDQPLRWKRPRMIFVNSMSDLFHERVPGEYIARVFAVMAAAHQHTFQVLTKRPARMAALLADNAFWSEAARHATHSLGAMARLWGDHFLPNVWLGVSVENRRFVHRADVLREIPAAVRFVSAEPLLGPLCEWMFCSTCSLEGPDPQCDECQGCEYWPLEGGLDLTDIDWLICGGESGPGHRPMRAEWMRDLLELALLYETAVLLQAGLGIAPRSAGPHPGRHLAGQGAPVDQPRGAEHVTTPEKPSQSLCSYASGFRFATVLAVKGSRRTLAPGRRQVNLFTERKREHSRKPERLYDIVEACSPGPYLELFARHPRRGWHRWGNELAAGGSS